MIWPHLPSRQRVGLLGGSFNPAHQGHLHVSREALKRLRLDRVWWLVAPHNPLKPAAELAPLGDRMASARAVARHPRLLVTDLEARLGTRFTVDTLARLGRRYPRARFVWLMGADNLLQLPAWRQWTRICRRVAIAVFARRSYDSRALAGRAAHRFGGARLPMRRARLLATTPAPAWAFLAVRRHPASASAIRRAKQWPGTGQPQRRRSKPS